MTHANKNVQKILFHLKIGVKRENQTTNDVQDEKKMAHRIVAHILREHLTEGLVTQPLL